MTAIWEVSIGHDKDLTWWLQSVRERWPDTQVLTEGAFGMEWRKHTPNNALLDYRFDAKGTGDRPIAGLILLIIFLARMHWL